VNINLFLRFMNFLNTCWLFLVSHKMRKHIKVAVGGLDVDELTKTTLE
jgi:hypothetical protein